MIMSARFSRKLSFPIMELHYKGFSAKVIYCADVGVFYGEVRGNCLQNNLIAFQASALKDCQMALQDAVDLYLEFISLLTESSAIS